MDQLTVNAICEKIADEEAVTMIGGIETVNDYGVKCAQAGFKAARYMSYDDGFDMAMNLVYETLNAEDFILAYTMADVIGIIESAEELFRKEG